MNTLTPRQTTMLERLEIFCNKVKRESLPLIIEEVWGFGSFFRLKDNPKDVDLVLKYSSNNPLYSKFKPILDKTLSNNLNRDESPKDALLQVAKNELSKKDFERLSPIFGSWMESYTWNIIFGGLMSMPEFQINEVEITKRVILRDLRGLQVSQIVPKENSLDELRAENIVLVWDVNNSNASANLEAILSPENVRLARINELENFNNQISSHKAEHDILLFLLTHVKKLRITKGDFSNYRKTLVQKACKKFPHLDEKILKQVVDNELIPILSNTS